MGGGRNFEGKQFHHSTPRLERWIADTGSIYADGSRDNPFCPESADFHGFANVLAEALHHLPGPVDNTDEDTPRCLRALPGYYDAEGAVVVPGGGSYFFLADGEVIFEGELAIEREFDSVDFGSTQQMFLAFGGGGIWHLPNTTITVYDNGLRAIPWGLSFERVFGPDLTQGLNTFTSDCQFHAEQSSFGTTFTLADVNLFDLDRVSFEGSVTAEEANLLRSVVVEADVTLSGIPTAALAMWLACIVGGDFTGPAGSATFDEITASFFDGAFGGGAGPDDYLNSDMFVLFSGDGRDLASSSTESWLAVVPRDADVISIHTKCTVTPVVAAGTCLADADAEGANLLNAATYDMELLPADTWTAMTLTGTAADLVRNEGDSLSINVVTNNALTGGTGTNVRWAVRMQAREV